MGHARNHHEFRALPGAATLRIVFPATAKSVRHSLRSVVEHVDTMAIPPKTVAAVEIVLAEVLNNVVEHAYGGGNGVIELSLERLPDALCFEVIDDGGPMPGFKLPPGLPVDLEKPQDEIPEGGFGWLLIRELTDHLAYERFADRNQLRFRVPIEQPHRPN